MVRYRSWKRAIRTKDVEERVLQAEELVLVVRHDVGGGVECCLRGIAVLWR